MEMVHFIPPSQRRLAILASQADTAPVLISGGSGTGKGAIAKWIHENSARSAKPLINASTDKSLAQQIPLAQGGTLFIPEIGSQWGLGEQKILLDFLNTRSIQIPSQLKMIVNTRIMVATSHSLDLRAQGGLFNGELLAKLNVFRLDMPPLVKRTDEFEDIASGMLGEMIHDLKKTHLRTFSPEAWEKLKSYDWPGNLRELRNVLRLAVVKAMGDRIEAHDLPTFGHDQVDFRQTREKFEKTYIAEILKTFQYELDRVCSLTKMDRNALVAKIRQYNLDPDNRLRLGLD